MINGIHHVSLTTSNLDRMVDFYTTQLGFEVVWTHHIQKTPDIDAVVGEADASFKVAMLRTGTAFVEVFERQNSDGTERSEDVAFAQLGYKHFALDVTDVDAEYERLSKAGVRFNSPPKTFANVKGAYAYDPDGNIFELQEILHEKFPFHISRGGKLFAAWPGKGEPAEIEAEGERLKAALSGR